VMASVKTGNPQGNTAVSQVLASYFYLIGDKLIINNILFFLLLLLLLLL